jgi:hypothetical protein
MARRTRPESRELSQLVELRVPPGDTKLRRVDSDYFGEEAA